MFYSVTTLIEEDLLLPETPVTITASTSNGGSASMGENTTPVTATTTTSAATQGNFNTIMSFMCII